MAHAAHVGSYGVAAAFGVSVATGQSGATAYGVYSDLGRSRYSRGYGRRARADWCWDEAWDLRWGHHYSGWPGWLAVRSPRLLSRLPERRARPRT